jgi:hypothetical protein
MRNRWRLILGVVLVVLASTGDVARGAAWSRPASLDGLTHGDPSVAPWRAAAVSGNAVGPARPIASASGRSGLVEPLTGGRALILWSEGNGALEAKLLDPSGRLRPERAPRGRERLTDDALYGTRVLYTAGRFALVAWNDVDGRLRASVRRF